MCARVPETLPLYDILNEFQKGHSHMAVVVRHRDTRVEQPESKTSVVGKLNLETLKMFLVFA